MSSANRKRKELLKLGSSIDRKSEFVKKSKVSNDGKGEEVSFLFLYYFKNWHDIFGSDSELYKLQTLSLEKNNLKSCFKNNTWSLPSI